jgi:hypothetical protein
VLLTMKQSGAQSLFIVAARNNGSLLSSRGGQTFDFSTISPRKPKL